MDCDSSRPVCFRCCIFVTVQCIVYCLPVVSDDKNCAVCSLSQVDIFQMCVLEFESRAADDRFYHLEHFIDGHYIKYNSNSGFVEENVRCTPQVSGVEYSAVSFHRFFLTAQLPL